VGGRAREPAGGWAGPGLAEARGAVDPRLTPRASVEIGASAPPPPSWNQVGGGRPDRPDLIGPAGPDWARPERGGRSGGPARQGSKLAPLRLYLRLRVGRWCKLARPGHHLRLYERRSLHWHTLARAHAAQRQSSARARAYTKCVLI
jgi:hypothetical protein